MDIGKDTSFWSEFGAVRNRCQERTRCEISLPGGGIMI